MELVRNWRESHGYAWVMIWQLRGRGDPHFNVDLLHHGFEGWSLSVLVWPWRFTVEWRLGFSKHDERPTDDGMPF